MLKNKQQQNKQTNKQNSNWSRCERIVGSLILYKMEAHWEICSYPKEGIFPMVSSDVIKKIIEKEAQPRVKARAMEHNGQWT